MARDERTAKLQRAKVADGAQWDETKKCLYLAANGRLCGKDIEVGSGAALVFVVAVSVSRRTRIGKGIAAPGPAQHAKEIANLSPTIPTKYILNPTDLVHWVASFLLYC